MLSRIATLVEQVAESLLSVVGLRFGTEEPGYRSESIVGGVEIRHYGPRLAAETIVDGKQQQALNEGFRRLAGYIFGGNHDGTSIDMTAPVSRQRDGQRIAMTAPVVQARGTPDAWVVRFFMPSKWTLQTLPVPNDDRVQLREIAAETVAVLRFSGDRGDAAITARTAQLLRVLSDNGIRTAGQPAAWFYDPPWTLPFRRRNEVVVPVA